MTISSETASQIETIVRSLEARRETLSTALATPETSGGVSPTERNRVEEWHHRITAALAALRGEAGDW